MTDGASNSGADWTRLEVEATVADYIIMLAHELRGESYNKAEHNRNLRSLINRSRGAIELKHQNISAVLLELAMPWINGYKPRGNYQELLREVVIEQVEANRSQVLTVAAAAVEAPIREQPPLDQFDKMQVPVPRSGRDFVARQPPLTSQPRLTNYLEIESRNRQLGLAGELFAARFEERRLASAGRKDLAARIEHVSTTLGDGLGYDISSFEADGRPRLIEVKTTSFGALTPFYLSKNELAASAQLVDHYRLYRIFNFRKRAQFFALAGSLQELCSLEPSLYLARIG
jgi:hypothetical protein